MIPQAAIIHWRNFVPWPQEALVEQDLILSRALVEIFQDPLLSRGLMLRGGTALHKLFVQPSRRYSDDIDLHRPYVDGVTFNCPHCTGTMRRVTEVMDCWFDSGAMPFAQWHYPFENQSLLDSGRFPADFICEAVDQTRGWFYSLHAVSTLLLDKP